MKLSSVAKHFDRLVATDAYNQAWQIRGQMDVFDDSRRDGMTIERRILSVAPEISMPPRSTLKADDLVWLAGDHHRDYFKGSAIRHKYVLHQATELVSVKTFAEAIGAAAGYQAWASRIWIKGSKEIEISSDITNVYDIYFAPNEPLAEGTVVFMDNRWHLIRTLYPSTAGLLVALADELPEPVVVSASFGNNTYNPTTDTYTGTPTVVTGMRLHWQSHFRYPTKGVSRYKSGDQVLMVRRADITPKDGDRVTINGDVYLIESKLDEGLCWSLHLRNV